MNEVKVSSLKLSSIKLGSSTSNNMTYVEKVGKLVLPRTSCFKFSVTSNKNVMDALVVKREDNPLL
jgi:hypothetical protein